jgi:hypothetical protein
LASGGRHIALMPVVGEHGCELCDDDHRGLPLQRYEHRADLLLG